MKKQIIEIFASDGYSTLRINGNEIRFVKSYTMREEPGRVEITFTVDVPGDVDIRLT